MLDMTLIFFGNNETSRKLKCTIQSSGKLGFTDATAKYLRLDKVQAVKFATDDNEKDRLYLINDVPASDANAFKVCRAGTYYHVNAKCLFEDLNLDFKSNKIMFDLKREPKYEDMKVYKMIKRTLPRKNKKQTAEKAK